MNLLVRPAAQRGRKIHFRTINLDFSVRAYQHETVTPAGIIENHQVPPEGIPYLPARERITDTRAGQKQILPVFTPGNDIGLAGGRLPGGYKA